MRHKKQLNLRLDPATCEAITELAAGKHINAFMEELVQHEVARRRGELLDTQTLPVMREMIQQEFLRVIADLHLNLREEIRHQGYANKVEIIAEMKARERRSDDRLAGLIIRAIREGGISRRMLFSYLAQTNYQEALEIYEDALAKVGKDLTKRLDDPQPS
jgi:hypothetical protein